MEEDTGDAARRLAQEHARLIAALPGTKHASSGEQALKVWEQLKAAGNGWPVVIGDEDNLGRVAEQAHGFEGDPSQRSVVQILDRARTLQHPASYLAYKKEEEQRAAELLARVSREQRMIETITIKPDGTHVSSREDPLAQSSPAPPLGNWPGTPPPSAGLSVATELRKVDGAYQSRPLRVAHILVLPTRDFTEIPALLRWGGWNDCPPPEYHVAALRSWRDRYGAELVGVNADTLNLRVKRKPNSREEAVALAHEMYGYCPDIVDQGMGTLSALAAGLMNDDWWYFWWD